MIVNCFYVTKYLQRPHMNCFYVTKSWDRIAYCFYVTYFYVTINWIVSMFLCDQELVCKVLADITNAKYIYRKCFYVTCFYVTISEICYAANNWDYHATRILVHYLKTIHIHITWAHYMSTLFENPFTSTLHEHIITTTENPFTRALRTHLH